MQSSIFNMFRKIIFCPSLYSLSVRSGKLIPSLNLGGTPAAQTNEQSEGISEMEEELTPFRHSWLVKLMIPHQSSDTIHVPKFCIIPSNLVKLWK